jgi:UDP-glucose 4-epimerase
MNKLRLTDQLKNKYKSAIVTGGAGFIGSHICEFLVKGKVKKVISVDDYSAGKNKNIFHLTKKSNFFEEKCDITNEKNLNSLFVKYRPDIIFHNAASKKNICLKNPIRDLEVNAGGTLKILTLAREFKVKKFIHASTGSVYGEAVYTPQNEDHPLNPVSFYGTSKLAGEKYVKTFNYLYGLDTTILRYFHVYGPRQEFNEYGGVVAIFIRNMLKNENLTIFGDGTQERSFTHVKDVVSANVLCAIDKKSYGETYNCASGISVTINDLCLEIMKYFGKEKSLKPIYKEWQLGDIKKFNIDNSKIKKVGLIFRTNFKEMLGETIKETIKYVK